MAVAWLGTRVGWLVGVPGRVDVARMALSAGVGKGLTGLITPRRYVMAMSTRQPNLALTEGTWYKRTTIAARPRMIRTPAARMRLPWFLGIGAILPPGMLAGRLEIEALGDKDNY